MKRKRKTVYIAHPISGDVEGNTKRVLEICKQVHTKCIVPVVPYIPSLQYLRDEVTKDRNLGMDASLEYFYRRYVDELWLFGDTISSGMVQEMGYAIRYGKIPIFLKTDGTKRFFRETLIGPHGRMSEHAVRRFIKTRKRC